MDGQAHHRGWRSLHTYIQHRQAHTHIYTHPTHRHAWGQGRPCRAWGRGCRAPRTPAPGRGGRSSSCACRAPGCTPRSPRCRTRRGPVRRALAGGSTAVLGWRSVRVGCGRGASGREGCGAWPTDTNVCLHAEEAQPEPTNLPPPQKKHIFLPGVVGSIPTWALPPHSRPRPSTQDRRRRGATSRPPRRRRRARPARPAMGSCAPRRAAPGCVVLCCVVLVGCLWVGSFVLVD